MAKNEENLKHVSDVLDYERDIRGKRLIRLYAGVGAGKNYWTKQLADQDVRLLLITSRAATADAQSKKLDAARRIDYEQLSQLSWDALNGVTEDCWGDLPKAQRRVVCTNAHIERFMKERYRKDNPKTHIWNKFDLIILDEAHSLTTDATFSESPFYVERFLRYAYRANPACDIIFMSGTLEPVHWTFKHNGSLQGHEINLFKQCIHHEPQRVILYLKAAVVRSIFSMYKNNHRVIYFVNHIKDMPDIITRLVNLGVPQNAIGISYSDSTRDSLFPEDMLKAKASIENELITKECLPSEIKIFLTTAKNKEGISILDEDIQYVFADSHVFADLTQMVARVRHDIYALFIVCDAPQFYSDSWVYEEQLEKKVLQQIRNHFCARLFKQ